MKAQKKIIIILFIIFFVMFVLNMITPLIMDDFNYTYGLDGKINSLKDILEYQKWFYFNWGGRNIAHIFAQFFLMNNKIMFNVLNAGMFTLMIYLIYEIIREGKKHHPLYLILIFFFLWFFTPAFGQAFLWLTGSCNYLWTTTIMLIFLNIFIRITEKEKEYNTVKVILFGVLGILAGWTNENTGASLVFMLLAYVFIKILKKEKLTRIQIAGIVGVLIGFIIMIVAPENYIRGNGFHDDTFILLKWLKRALSITQTATNFLGIPIIIFIVLITIYFYKKQKINQKIYFFFIGLIISIYSMVVSPQFPERSWTIMIIYMIILCGILFNNIKIKEKLKKFIIIDAVIIISFLFVGSYILTFKDSYHFYNNWQNRIETIKKGKKEGIKEFEFEPMYTRCKQSASYGLGDLYPSKKDPNNKTYARYFGIKSINARPNK